MLSLSLPEIPVSGSDAVLRGNRDNGTRDRGHREYIRVGRVNKHWREEGPPSLLVYSALGTPPFRSVRLRKRRASCPACGTEGQKLGTIEDIDYVQFCGGERPDYVSLGREPGTAGFRITASELRDIVEHKPESVRIIDVRPRAEFGICHLPWSINVPLQDIVANPADHLSAPETYVVCRLGINSQIAADALRDVRSDPTFVIKDVVGGLRSWSHDINPNFPIY